MPSLQNCHYTNEDPSSCSADIARIREWLKNQPHIRANPDDQTLIAFLRGCKFSLERTKEKIDTYYTIRTTVPEFFKNRNVRDDHYKALAQTQSYFPLNGYDPKGRRVIIVRMGGLNYKIFTLQEYLKMCLMVQDVLLREDETVASRGYVILVDLAGMTLGLTLQFSPSLAKRSMLCTQNTYPVMVKGIHFINIPSYGISVISLIKRFLKEKIRKRVFLHGENLESLYKTIPKHILPTEYGGQGGEIQKINDSWQRTMDSYHYFLMADEDFGVDETKRIKKENRGFFTYFSSMFYGTTTNDKFSELGKGIKV